MATMEDEIIMRLEEQGAKYFIDVGTWLTIYMPP
jgi:hypothetical protein